VTTERISEAVAVSANSKMRMPSSPNSRQAGGFSYSSGYRGDFRKKPIFFRIASVSGDSFGPGRLLPIVDGRLESLLSPFQKWLYQRASRRLTLPTVVKRVILQAPISSNVARSMFRLFTVTSRLAFLQAS
jgi:hypothetical protein